MFLFSVLILCWVFTLHRTSYESEALILYDPRSRYYSYNLARGGYGKYYDQEKIKIYSSASATQPKRTYHKRTRSKTETQPSIDLSFEPLGALKIDSLTHGEIEFNPEALDDILLSIASGTLSMIPDFYQYIPSLSSLYGDNEPTESSSNQSHDESSRPRKHHRSSDQDDASEENHRSSGDIDDESGKKHDNSENSTNDKDYSEDRSDKSDYDKEHEDDDDNAAEEQDEVDKDHSKSKHSGSSEQKNNSQDDKDEPASENGNSKESSKNSKEKSKEEVPEIGTEVPTEGLPAQEGYVDKFVKYYSYAKPVAKAASLFFPGLGQYRAVMYGMEMANVAYETASMYQNGDGYLTIGWHLGKEAFKRLGRRSEPLEEPKDPDTKASSIDAEEFLNQVKNTRYPSLDEEKEQKIKSSVTRIVRKYFHDQKEYKNKTKRAKFIDLMVSCVKFIALQQIIPAANDEPSN